MSARLRLVPRAAPTAGPPAPREAPIAGVTRLILLKLSELAHHQREAKRVETELAPLARAFADHHGEFPRPTAAQLRCRLGVK